MEIAVLNLQEEVDQLIIERTGNQVRVLHQEQTVADVLVDDLIEHLAMRSRPLWPICWWRNPHRAWDDFTVTLTRRRKVRLMIKGRIGVNTLTAGELQNIEDLLAAAVPSPGLAGPLVSLASATPAAGGGMCSQSGAEAWEDPLDSGPTSRSQGRRS